MNTAITQYNNRCTFWPFTFSASSTSISIADTTAPIMKTQPQHWLVKSEPEAYAWTDLVRDRRTAWTGVRNYQARIHLNAMRPGDHVLFYESVGPKSVAGLAEVTKSSFPDTTADEPGWVAVEIKAGRTLAQPVTLAQIKADPLLAEIALVRQSRLSVLPLSAAEYARIVQLGS
jgi:predicted RNA-binding protein with PUA-like domain